MLFKFTCVATIALLSLLGSVNAINCPQGQGNVGGSCQTCPAGTFGPGGGNAICHPCNPGTGKNVGAHSQSTCGTCPAGTFSTSGSGCENCPAGSGKNAGATSSSGCGACSPGTFAKGTGAACTGCPAGQFTSQTGATGCCSCCAGTYSSHLGTGSTECFKCLGGFTSNPGSNAAIDCHFAFLGPPAVPSGSCVVSNSGFCPPTTNPGPSSLPMKKRAFHCTRSYTACPHYSGRGGWDCVDTKNDPEMCGGCVETDGTGEGKDCYSLPGVSTVSCNQGKCMIGTCRKGFSKSEDGESCIARDGSSDPSLLPNVVAQGSRRARRSNL